MMLSADHMLGFILDVILLFTYLRIAVMLVLGLGLRRPALA